MATQGAISLRVQRYKPALSDHQAARGRKEETGELLPMTWGWDILTRSREGTRAFCRGRKVQVGAFEKGKRDICWFGVIEEGLLLRY